MSEENIRYTNMLVFLKHWHNSKPIFTSQNSFCISLHHYQYKKYFPMSTNSSYIYYLEYLSSMTFQSTICQSAERCAARRF